jgi:hypothetical protein
MSFITIVHDPSGLRPPAHAARGEVKNIQRQRLTLPVSRSNRSSTRPTV